jgi:hypothetical protein
MKLLIMQFPPISRHIIPLRSKYSPQQLILLRRRIFEVHFSDELRWRDIHTRFYEDWYGRSSNTKDFLQQSVILQCSYD